MKRNHNTKKQYETGKFNNGLKSLIERYEGAGSWYIKKVNEYLLEKHGLQFPKGDISRVVNDAVKINPRLILIKEACEAVMTDWGRLIGDLKPNQRLFSTPKGIIVITETAADTVVA